MEIKGAALVAFSICMILSAIPVTGTIRSAQEEEIGMVSEVKLVPVDPGSADHLTGSVEKWTGAGRSIIGMDVVPDPHFSSSRDTTYDPINAEYAFSDSKAPTRASDDEGEQNYGDFPNGSYMSTTRETINGELSYDPSGSSDQIDWYKFDVTDLVETAGSVDGLRNVTISLLDLTDGLGTYDALYEYGDDGDGNLLDDYADMIYISMIYTDPYGQIINAGGLESSFDDQDDNDGWIHDGDHPDHPDNWTLDLVTPRNSIGQLDDDGWANGLTEMAWYYVGVSFNFFIAQGAPQREAFTIRYSLEIDTTDREDTDDASNTRETAATDTPSGEKWIHSTHQPMDWYKLEGSDPSSLWNISVRANRTDGRGYFNNDNGMRWDSWLHVFFVWRDPGDDKLWNTDDDIWRYFHHILSFFLTGGRFVGGENQTVGYYYPSIELEAEHREAYIGLIAEPATYEVDNGQVSAVFDPYWTCWSRYTIDLTIREEEPNNAPVLSDIEISSDWMDSPAGGHFGSWFMFNVSYTDEDNDPPLFLEMVIDPDTFEQITVDLLDHPEDPADLDYTDGKRFLYRVQGEDIGEYHSPHVVFFSSSDLIGPGSVRTTKNAFPVYVNDTLYVWNDEPISLNPLYEGLPEVLEDTEYRLQSTEIEGMFRDPENNFKRFFIWNGEQWSGDLDTDLLHINISEDQFGWFGIITPKPNMNGQEIIRIRGEDDHSSMVYEGTITVRSVNDPPVIDGIKVGSRIYGVQERNPFSYMIDLEAEGVSAVEDQVNEFQVLASDMDGPDEIVPLIYHFTESSSDDWEGIVEIDENSGVITVIPTNGDIRRESSDIMIEVHDDGGERNIIELLLTIGLENTPDEPVIDISPNSDTTYSKDDTVEIIMIGDDPDPDEVLTYDVSVTGSLLDGTDPLIDQLPFTDLIEDDNWGFDESTGRFWWELSDYRIWKTTADTISDRVEVTLTFSVTDSTDKTVYKEITLILTDGEVPEVEVDFTYTIKDDHPITIEVEGKTVRFRALETLNPESLDVEMKWDTGEGDILEGADINHTFDTFGAKTVYYWFETDFTVSQKESFTFTLTEVPEEEPDPDPESKFPTGLVIGITFTIILVILIVIILMMMRRRKAEVLSHGDHNMDMSDRGARQMELSPSDHYSNSLGGSVANEKLPPAGKTSGTGIIGCPSCGSQVKEGWYLCPNCKNPLE